MSWIVTNWRLKLLAVVLSIGLLGAVAFSENPVTVRTVVAAVDFDNRPDDIVVIGPPPQVQVTLVGLSSNVNAVADHVPNGVRFSVNLAKVRVGAHQTFYARPKTLPTGVNWNGDQVAVAVDIDHLASTPAPGLDIEVRTPNVTAGYKVLPNDPAANKLNTYAYCGNVAQVCHVKVTGPAAILEGLKAFVQIDSPINSDSVDSPSQPVRFEQNGHPVDLLKITAVPGIGWDPTTVTARITAQRSQATRQVAVAVRVNGRPSCGYAVTGLRLSDPLVSISGGNEAVVAVGGSVNLPNAVDISNATSDVSLTEPVTVPSGVTVQPGNVTVTVGISKQFDCSAPTPSPTPVPSPTPTR